MGAFVLFQALPGTKIQGFSVHLPFEGVTDRNICMAEGIFNEFLAFCRRLNTSAILLSTEFRWSFFKKPEQKIKHEQKNYELDRHSSLIKASQPRRPLPKDATEGRGRRYYKRDELHMMQSHKAAPEQNASCATRDGEFSTPPHR